jgi:hypothetical protein
MKFRIYKTIILPVVLYRYQTCSPTLRQKHRLKVFENRVLQRIFGPKRDEATGGWGKLHTEELHNSYSSQSIITIMRSRTMRWVWHVARMVEKRNVYRIFVGKLELKRPLGRPRSRCVDNIKMDLREIGWMVWIGLLWFRIGTSGRLL